MSVLTDWKTWTWVGVAALGLTFGREMIKSNAETFEASGSSSKVMKEKEAINALTTAKGKFMTVNFLKKDGTSRRMRCRTGVKRYVKGVGSPLGTPSNRLQKYKLITVYDLDKAGYRSIPVDRVISVKAGGKTYNSKNPKGKQMSAEEYNSYNAEWEAIFDVYGRRGYFADLPDKLTEERTEDEILEMIMDESDHPEWEEVDEMIPQGIEKHAETFNSDTWRSNPKKLAYMSSKVHELHPHIPEEIIFDFAEGGWPHDWDEAAEELIIELQERWGTQIPMKVMVVKAGELEERDGKMIIHLDESDGIKLWEEAIKESIEEGDYEIVPTYGDEDWDEVVVSWVGHPAWEKLKYHYYEAEKRNCGCGQDPCITYGAETCGAESYAHLSDDEIIEKNNKLIDVYYEVLSKDWTFIEGQDLLDNPSGNNIRNGPDYIINDRFLLKRRAKRSYDGLENFEADKYCKTCSVEGHDSCSMTQGCPCCDETMDSLEFAAPYVGAGALMDIGKDTGLGSFSPSELATSSAIHGDFDQASLNYSGKQNLEVRAESDRDEDEDDYEAYLRLQGLCECTACGDVSSLSTGTTDKQGLYRCVACVTASKPSISEEELVEDLDYLRGVY